jgi:nitrogen regulatory protein PII
MNPAPLQKHTKTLLAIVAEAALEKNLVRDARERGAQGWTVTEVHGAGREGMRAGDWEADRTVELRVICDEAVADAIASHVLATYAPYYSVALYFSTVQVLRPDRF